MSPSRSSRRPRVVVRYWLAQLPATLAFVAVIYIARHLFDLPGWIAIALVACWVLADAGLYFLVWRSYDPDLPGLHSLEGMIGTAVGAIGEAGRVRVRGELWRARLVPGAAEIAAGAAVRIVAVEGLTLFVETADPE